MPNTAYRLLCSVLITGMLVAGALQAFTQWPLQVPDESVHWVAAVNRTNLFIPGRDSHCDSLLSLPDEIFEMGRILSKPNLKGGSARFEKSLKPTSQCIETILPYGFALSYPGVVAALFMRQLVPLSDVSVFFLARIFQGMMSIILVAFLLLAIAKAPRPAFWKSFFGLAIALLFLAPLPLQQNFGVSSDSIVNAFALLLAIFLVQQKAQSWSLFGAYLCLGGAACITKPPLMALLFPLWWWLRTHKSFGSKRWEMRFLACTAAIVISTLATSAMSVRVTEPLAGTDPGAQLAFLLSHPLRGIWTLVTSPLNFIWISWPLSLGMAQPLGWLDYGPTMATLRAQKTFQRATYIYFLIPLISGIRTLKISLKRPSGTQILADAIWLAGLLAFMAAISLFLYLFWTPVGASHVDGFQMRYFIPHYVLLYAWLGVRLDQICPLSFKPRSFAPRLVIAANVLVGAFLLAYVVERNFSNLVRYF